LNLVRDDDKRRFREGESRMITRIKDAGRVWTYKTTSQSEL